MLSDREFQFASSEEVLDRLMELDVEMQFLRSEMEGYESAGMKDDPNYFDMSEEFEAYRMEYFDLCGQDWVAEQEEVQNAGTSDGGMSGGPTQSLPQDDEDGGMSEEPNQSLPQDDEDGGMSEEPNQSTTDDESNLTCDPRWWEDDYDAPAAGDGENVCLRPEKQPCEPPSTGEIQQIAGTDVHRLARVKILDKDGPGYLALRERPDRSAKELTQLYPNDPVIVIRKLNLPGWSLVVTEPIEGQEGQEGLVGYVWDTFLSVDPPEPGAILHLIAEDEECEQIVTNYYGRGVHLNDDELGFYGNVLVYANERTDGREPGISESWFGQPNVEEGYLIWIPSQAFSDTLKGKLPSYSGKIEKNIWGTVVAILEYTPEPVQYIVGFLAGVVQGVLECVWDALVGIKDLIVLCLELVWEILKLEYILHTQGAAGVAKQVYDKVKELRAWFAALKWDDIKFMLEGWLSNVEYKFFHPNYTERGHFHGFIVGYILAEVVIAIWTGGTVAAAKWSGRLGEIARFINKFKWVRAIAEHGEKTANDARRIAEHLRKSGWRRKEFQALEEIARRIARLEKEGHAPQRHGGPNRVTDRKLVERAVERKDPVTGTVHDAYNKNPDGTPALHKVGKHASAFTSDEALVKADDFARSTQQFKDNVAAAKAAGTKFIEPVDVSLKDVFGDKYREAVRGVERLGTKNAPTGHSPINFTDGTARAIYRIDDKGNVVTHTLYPEPK